MSSNDRSREVFRRVVEGYLDSGDPGGLAHADTIHEREKVSAATIRNVMQDLEFLGLLDSARMSRPGACRPSLGLRMFVDGSSEVGELW
jgi:heat-inducible transcriptional repressor